MAEFSDKMKKAWMKSMEAIGNTASSIADNTRYKVNEMNLVNRRREILSDFGAQAYALWQKGESFPEELAKKLEELSRVDKELNALRTEHLAGVNTADTAKADAPAQDAEAPVDEAAQKIDEAVQQAEAAAKKADINKKADAALDTIGSTLKSVGTSIGNAISSMANSLSGKKTDKPAEKQPEAAKPAQPEDVPTLVIPEEDAQPDDLPVEEPDELPAEEADDLPAEEADDFSEVSEDEPQVEASEASETSETSETSEESAQPDEHPDEYTVE